MLLDSKASKKGKAAAFKTLVEMGKLTQKVTREKDPSNRGVARIEQQFFVGDIEVTREVNDLIFEQHIESHMELDDQNNLVTVIIIRGERFTLRERP